MVGGTEGLSTVSLRRRVTITSLAVFGLVLVALTLVVNAAFGVTVNRSVTAVLNDHVQLARQLARANTPPAQLVSRLENRSVRARLVLSDGRVLGNLGEGAAAQPDSKARELRLPNATGPLAGARLTLEVDARLLSGARQRLLRVLLLTATAALAVVAVGVPLAVRYGLAPLDAMTRLAREVAAGRRGRRLAARSVDTELGRTASAFDEMLDSLERAERRALASEEGMRRFVADAAHELRTPLAGIAAAAEAVLQSPNDADVERRQRLLLVLGREAHRAGRIVEDLLDLARIDSGLSLHPEPTDLRRLAEGQVEPVSLLHPGLDIRVDGPPVRATVDPARIGQVLANLLNNACRVSPAGSAVRIAVSHSNNTAYLAVSDCGPGVPAEQREQIFQRLVRLPDAGSAGAGLGLPIARGIARAHGGDVTCMAVPTGAVFVLSVPC